METPYFWDFPVSSALKNQIVAGKHSAAHFYASANIKPDMTHLGL
jgi:hypothetical protein